eukprot:3675393-Rhodomonas_salina.1
MAGVAMSVKFGSTVSTNSIWHARLGIVALPIAVRRSPDTRVLIPGVLNHSTPGRGDTKIVHPGTRWVPAYSRLEDSPLPKLSIIVQSHALTAVGFRIVVLVL